MRSKLEIVSGFLSSGKTSFINSYLTTEVCKNEKILVVLLEKGTTNIVRNLNYVKVVYLEKANNVKELLLKEMQDEKYNRIIIEFNGTYNLNIVTDLLKDKKIKEKISFYGNYYIGDCKNLDVYIKNIGELIIPFIQSSKLIILNNINYISEKKKETIVKTIENINFTAPIIKSFSINTLKEDLGGSNYFKESKLTRMFKTLFNKGEYKK